MSKNIGVMVAVIMYIAVAKVSSPPLYDCLKCIRITDSSACELEFNSQTLEHKSYVNFAAIQGYILPTIVMVFCGTQSVRNGRFDLKIPEQ